MEVNLKILFYFELAISLTTRRVYYFLCAIKYVMNNCRPMYTALAFIFGKLHICML